MLKILLPLILCILQASTLQSQNPFTIEGFVLDSVSRQPVQGASIRLLCDGKLMNGAITDSIGYYHITYFDSAVYNLLVNADLDGYTSILLTDLLLSPGQKERQDFLMTFDLTEYDISCVCYKRKPKFISLGEFRHGLLFTREQLLYRVAEVDRGYYWCEQNQPTPKKIKHKPVSNDVRR